MGTNVVNNNHLYTSLNNFKLEITNNVKSSFSLCFWIFLPTDSSPFPSTLIHQKNSDIVGARPFLALAASREMVLYPIGKDTSPIIQGLCARTKNEIPLNKWVHVGCEVCTDVIRIYFNGAIAGEMRVTCTSDSLKKISLVGANENDSIDVHGVEILPTMSFIKDYFVKNPPVQLYFDAMSVRNIEEDSDGVWSVVGGKASFCRNFSMNVALMNAFGHTVNKEMEVVATLTYADNGAPVEKLDDSEAPLLTINDGIEFASWDRPIKLIDGHASFRLKISQLSSKCDNRLFRIKFCVIKMGKRHRFLEAYSPLMRCISPSLNARPSTLIWKRSTSAMHVVSGTSWLNGGSLEPVNNVVHEAKPAPSSKRIKLGQGIPFMSTKSDNLLKQRDLGIHEDATLNCKTLTPELRPETNESRTLTPDVRQETHERTCNTSFDSDSSEATNTCDGSPISDVAVFKYCLGSFTERSQLLKELSSLVSEKDIMVFAVQVSQFTGCLHHRNQIRISKRMIEDGMKVWNLLSQNNGHVSWNNMILVIRDQFMRISCCRNRYLALQDFEVLRSISGCQEHVSKENFEKLWCWLYPVAFGLSQNGLNEMWDSRWIEGLITKEEAEVSLHGPGNCLVDPGTFVLRFPTSRSWPHPDAGNLIVTYVGSDFVIHHRLLSLDFFHSCLANEMPGKSLKEMLLEECELSRLGRQDDVCWSSFFYPPRFCMQTNVNS